MLILEKKLLLISLYMCIVTIKGHFIVKYVILSLYLIFQMKEALSEIIQLATVDSEPWVLMVADILKSFPETGSLNLDLEEQNPNVQDILGELREKGWSINNWSASKWSKVIVNNFQFNICLFRFPSSSISSQ